MLARTATCRIAPRTPPPCRAGCALVTRCCVHLRNRLTGMTAPPPPPTSLRRMARWHLHSSRVTHDASSRSKHECLCEPAAALSAQLCQFPSGACARCHSRQSSSAKPHPGVLNPSQGQPRRRTPSKAPSPTRPGPIGVVQPPRPRPACTRHYHTATSNPLQPYNTALQETTSRPLRSRG